MTVVDTPDRTATIVVCCANVPCRNSELVGAELLNLGYASVYRCREGIEGWVGAGPAHGDRPLAHTRVSLSFHRRSADSGSTANGMTPRLVWASDRPMLSAWSAGASSAISTSSQ